MSELTTPLGAAWPKPPPAAWSPDDTMLWLDENPFPLEFRWPHRDALPEGGENLQPPMPKYRVTAYGKWLRETPYFPGLFEEIHELLVQMGTELPEDGRDLAQRLDARRRARGQQQKLL